MPRSPKKKCSRCGETSAAKDGFCYKCWKIENPEKEWPYHKRKEKKKSIPPEEKGDLFVYDEGAQKNIYKLLDVELLEATMNFVDRICQERGVRIDNHVRTKATALFYQMIYCEGVRIE